MFWFFVTVNDNERAILVKKGRFKSILEPGQYRLFNLFQSYKVEKFNIVKSEFTNQYADVIAKQHPALAEKYFTTVNTGDGEVAIVYFDDQPTHLVGPWNKRHFWHAITDVNVEMIDTKPEIRLKEKHRAAIDIDKTNLVKELIVGQNQAGLLFVDGELTKTLKPGRHTFWETTKEIEFRLLDLRPTPHEITAQEILTKDRVTLRVTLTAFLKVTDPVKAISSSSDYTTYIHRLVQFALREAITTRTLDEALNNRESIDKQIRTYVKEHIEDIGVVVSELGIKDIILPGDMRDLINKVVEAEKLAQANLIRRREETAATRSLLNTAKLMDDNPTLMRLKELEALEKLTEKVGTIELVSGRKQGALDNLLKNLISINNGKKNKNKNNK